MIRAIPIALAAAVTALSAGAQDGPSPAERAQLVREGLMQNYAFNIGPLGAMAKGEIEYDAARAEMLAANIATLAQVSLAPYWVEGSSSADLPDSRALPAIWENQEDVDAKRQDLFEAAQALQAAAPEGQEAFTQAFRAVGEGCGGCHEDFRKPKDE